MLNVWPIYLHWVVLGVNVGKYAIHWASAYMLHMYSHWKSIGNDFGTSLHVIRHIGSFVSWESSFPSPFAHQVGVPHRHLKLLQGPNGQNNKKKTNNSQHLQVGVPLKPQRDCEFFHPFSRNHSFGTPLWRWWSFVSGTVGKVPNGINGGGGLPLGGEEATARPTQVTTLQGHGHATIGNKFAQHRHEEFGLRLV